MAHVGGRADGHNNLGFRNVRGCGEHRGAAKGVADQDSRRGEVVAQKGGGTDQILDVGGEVGVGELTFRRSQPREIETQDANSEFASSAAIRFAASTSLVQVKQCANKAKARTAPAGRSRRALRSTPALPVKVARTMDAVGLEKVIWHLARSRNVSRV